MTQHFDTIDLDTVRADTLGVLNRNHLNSAGAALMPIPVLAAVIGHLRRESEIGGYEAAAEATDRLATIHASIATLVGASAKEIAITENATVAWQRAFQSMSFAPGDRILTSRAEFAANYIVFLQAAARSGVLVEVVPDDEFGALDPNALARMIDDKVRLIAITWLPTNGGLINPAAAVGSIARANGIPYLLDGCQAVGQMTVDVETLGCDMFTATGRKFLRAPRGTGFLYMRQDMLDRTEPAMLDLFGAEVDRSGHYRMRTDARRFETWETNYSTRLGLGAAVDYALAIGIDAIQARCGVLARRLRDGLSGIGSVRLRDTGEQHSTIVSFSVEHVEASIVMQRLTRAGINVSVSPPASTPLDAAARKLPPVVRASPHYYNTIGEIDALVQAIEVI
ncbi:aminotransferase class V [Novosphingobium endophyticum]|uniref:Aminotransferase class V n=1 Tax=Novosphingobium endophyticum TaxID=1955250 RepID=A0A916TV62_9SPHN|nr:aminotransferase class V-fold PLP-dependent enzyme [Novosphingobium endophyticum]GGC14007.1 aminotransferase class V [Novosphingobium endophyticum]